VRAYITKFEAKLSNVQIESTSSAVCLPRPEITYAMESPPGHLPWIPVRLYGLRPIYLTKKIHTKFPNLFEATTHISGMRMTGLKLQLINGRSMIRKLKKTHRLVILTLMLRSGSKQMPYLAHIKSLTPTWKTLRYLADWMEVGTTPLRWNEVNRLKQREERINKTVVTYVEYPFGATSKPQEIPITSPIALKELLHSLSHERNKETPLRLFIVEDLSQQVVEILGSRFDIDPMFFRDQVDDYVWHNVRDPWAQPPSLMSNMKHRQWFQMRNVRLRYYKTQKEFQEAWKEANTWNVQRRPDDDVNHWKFADRDGAVVSTMRTRTALWVGKDKQCGNGTVGILLLDPTTSQGQPLWYDRTNWLPVPKMHDPTPSPMLRLSESWYKDIISMTKTFPWFENGKSYEVNAQVLAKPALYTICAEWLVMCDYVKTRLSQIERELEMPRLFRSKGDAIEASLKRLHTWRRQIPIFKEMVTETLQYALPAAARLAASSSPAASRSTAPNSPMSAFSNRSLVIDTDISINFEDFTGYEDIAPDFLRISKAIDVLQERVDRLTDIVTSEINIEDSRRGLVENHNMARLTWLATVFIPLSFISSMYSMNEDITSLKTTYGWYWLTAVPFTLSVMLIGWMVGTESWTPWKDVYHRGIFGGKEVKRKEEKRKDKQGT
jgi:Mg2+ and Co2+ transporter CorA